MHAFDFGAVELENKKGERFKVNGQRLKHHWGGEVDRASISLILDDSF